MKLETANKVLIEESEFLGITFSALMQDIAKYGKVLYSEKVVEAYKTKMGVL